MKTVTVEANQSLRDIAIANYGTFEAVGELVALNNGRLRNDQAALVALGIDYLSDTAFYMDVAIEVGSVVTIDDQSKLVSKIKTRDIKTPQTKYE